MQSRLNIQTKQSKCTVSQWCDSNFAGTGSVTSSLNLAIGLYEQKVQDIFVQFQTTTGPLNLRIGLRKLV